MVALSSQQLLASAQRKPPARPHLHACWWFLATALAGLLHHPSLAEQVPLSKFDPSSLPRLPVVWAHDTNGTEPVRIGDQVFIVSPSGSAVTAVQAQTGAKLWTVAVPKGVTLGALQAHAPDLLLAQGYSTDAAVLLRISLAGKVLWQQSLAQLDDVSIARFGSGLATRDRAGCRQRILDAKTGQLQPEAQSLRGHHIERFGLHGGPMTSSCEVTASLLWWQPGLALATDYRGKHGLLAIDPRGNQKWALPGMAYRLLHQSPDAVVVFGYDAARHPQLLRLNPATGVVLWQRTRSGSCEDDHLSRHPQVYSSPELGPPGAPPRQSVLLQDCAHAELIELPSGQSLWTRPTQGALAVLDQLGPMNLGDPDESDHEYMVTSGAGTVAVQWFSGTGQPLQRVAVEPGVRGLTPVATGVIVQSNNLDRIWLLRRDGQPAWDWPIRFGNAYVRDDYLVVLPSQPLTTQVMLNLGAGPAYALPLGSPYVLGRAGGNSGLWLTTKQSPSQLVAVRLDAQKPAPAAPSH